MLVYSNDSKKDIIDYKFKKQIEKDITNLTLNQQTEILNIIKSNNQKYSQNKAGIYFNLKYIDNDTLVKLKNYIDNCKKSFIRNSEIDYPNSGKDKAIFTPTDKELKYTLDRKEIHAELQRLENKHNENFSFQNFLDKLSVTNIKTFKKNEKINYPQLKQNNKKFLGVNERLIKKCRDVNKDDETAIKNEEDSNECMLEIRSESSEMSDSDSKSENYTLPINLTKFDKLKA